MLYILLYESLHIFDYRPMLKLTGDFGLFTHQGELCESSLDTHWASILSLTTWGLDRLFNSKGVCCKA